MDTPRQPMVVTILLVLAEPLAEGRLREVLNRRLLLFARFRQRLVREGGRHVWIEDAAFDLSHHVEWQRLPEPADQRALAALVGEVASQSLVAGRPLWRCVVVENAGSGCALLFRVHHCVADGIALLRVFLTLTDRTPHPDEMPTARAISLEEQRDQARLAAKTAKAPKLFSSGLARLRWGGALLGGFLRQLLVIPETRTALRGRLNGQKRMAWSASIPLGDITRIRQRWGGWVNDVMLTVVTGALGRYLRARGDARPGLMARLAVPVNLRPYQEEIELGNQFAVVFLKLPLDVVDPVARLAAVRARMERVKSSPEAMANALMIRPPSSPTPGPVDSRRRRQSGAKEKRAWDEDEKAKRVGSLERDEPIFLPVETLRHRWRPVSARGHRSAREEGAASVAPRQAEGTPWRRENPGEDRLRRAANHRSPGVRTSRTSFEPLEARPASTASSRDGPVPLFGARPTGTATRIRTGLDDRLERP
jgi:WS/DGAT/MGAT family acyltransferase